MREVVRSLQVLVLGFVLSIVACGGGGGSGGGQPPPLQPDFAISLSTASLTLPQGSTSSPVNVSISPLNGFTSSVQVSLVGLPAGVTSNPASPFPVSASQSVSVLFGAAPDASAGQFNITAQGNSGMLSHSQELSLAIESAAQGNFSKTAYVENDSVASLDHPQGEPRQRHVVFDAARQRFYVANRALNRVEVFPAANPQLQSTIDAPGATSVELSPDGSTLWVGTALEYILAMDAGTLHVKSRYPVAGLTPIPGIVFIRLTEVLALAGGKLLVRLRQPAASESLLALGRFVKRVHEPYAAGPVRLPEWRWRAGAL